MELSTIKDKAVKGGAFLFARQLLTKCLGLLASIVLARLLIPEEFGAYAAVTCAVSFFNIFGDAGLAASLIRQPTQPTKEEESTIFSAQQVLIGLPTLLLALCAPAIAHCYKLSNTMAPVLATVAISGYISTFKIIPSIRLERELDFNILAKIELIQSLSYQGTAIVLASLRMGVWSFAVAALVSQLIAVGLTFASKPWQIQWSFDFADCKERLGFGFNYQAASVVSFLKDAVNPAFIGLLCGAKAVGLVGFANTTATYPILLTAAVGRIYLPLFSLATSDKQQLSLLAESVIRWNNIVIFGATSILLPMAHLLVPLVFGSKWNIALPILYGCMVPNLFVGTVWPLLAIANSINRADIPARYAYIFMLLTWVTAVPLVIWLGPVGYGVSQSVINLANFFLIKEIQSLVSIRLAPQILKPAVAAVANAIIIVIALRALQPSNLFTVILTAVSGAISFFCLANIIMLNRLSGDIASIFSARHQSEQLLIEERVPRC